MTREKNYAAYITVGVQFEAFSDEEVNTILEKYKLTRNIQKESSEEWSIRRTAEPEGKFRYELWKIKEDIYILGTNVHSSVRKRCTEKVDISQIKRTLDDVCRDIPDARVLLFSAHID